MKATILRPFLYSTDGVSSRALVVGDLEEIAADVFPGLKAEGFIAEFVEKKSHTVAPENVAVAGAPEDKAAAPATPAKPPRRAKV